MTRRTTSALTAIALSTALLAVPASTQAQAAPGAAPSPAFSADDLEAATASSSGAAKKGAALTLGSRRGAETYIVQLEPTLAGPLRSLAFAAAVAIDTALKQDDN